MSLEHTDTLAMLHCPYTDTAVKRGGDEGGATDTHGCDLCFRRGEAVKRRRVERARGWPHSHSGDVWDCLGPFDGCVHILPVKLDRQGGMSFRLPIRWGWHFI